MIFNITTEINIIIVIRDYIHTFHNTSACWNFPGMFMTLHEKVSQFQEKHSYLYFWKLINV